MRAQPNVFAVQSFSNGIDEFGRFCEPNEMISPAQCRAARGLLDWSQQELAKKAGVGVVTVRQLEAATHPPRRATLDVVRRCLESCGVEFIDENGGGAGVRLAQKQTETYIKPKSAALNDEIVALKAAGMTAANDLAIRRALEARY
jgi:transcriptional regulator with XRE-family HTH domain